MDNIITNNEIHNNQKLYFFWKIYDLYGLNKALEWLEINKYNNDLQIDEVNHLNILLNNVKI
jgi:hypothetical protein